MWPTVSTPWGLIRLSSTRPNHIRTSCLDFVYPSVLFAPPRDHRSFSGATLTCPGPSLCRGSQLLNGSHHLHPWRKHLLPWQALHYLPHLTWYYSSHTSKPAERVNMFHSVFIILFSSSSSSSLVSLILCSWILAHEQNAKHIVRTRA